MAKRIAIVAADTNLIGRTAEPRNPEQWPFQGPDGVTDKSAEIVAAYVSDLDEAGAIKFVLRGNVGGVLLECYAHAFVVRTMLAERDALRAQVKELRDALEALTNCITETRGPNAHKALDQARAALAKTAD